MNHRFFFKAFLLKTFQVRIGNQRLFWFDKFGDQNLFVNAIALDRNSFLCKLQFRIDVSVMFSWGVYDLLLYLNTTSKAAEFLCRTLYL